MAWMRLQCLHEVTQPCNIDVPSAWELKQEWTELLAQSACVGKQSLERLLRVFQFLHVGQVATGLHCEHEPRWSLALPGFKRLARRQLVVRVVDFDCWEIAREKREELSGRHFWRIELAVFPVLVRPAARPDPHRYHGIAVVNVTIRDATDDDAAAIARIYNDGIQDRVATLETTLRSEAERREWLSARGKRHPVLVAQTPHGDVIGWASLNQFNPRSAYDQVVDFSVYVDR